MEYLAFAYNPSLSEEPTFDSASYLGKVGTAQEADTLAEKSGLEVFELITLH